MDAVVAEVTAAAVECRHGQTEPISVSVWRCVEGLPEALFSFTGAVDVSVLRALLQQVERLARSVPGGGQIEVIASPLDAPGLQEAAATLRHLQRRGLRARLALLCARRAAPIAVPSLLLH